MPPKNIYKPLEGLTLNKAEQFVPPIMRELIEKRQPILASVICNLLFKAHEIYFEKTEEALFANNISVDSTGYIVEDLELYDIAFGILKDKTETGLTAEERKFLLSELDARLEDQLLTVKSPHREE